MGEDRDPSSEHPGDSSSRITDFSLTEYIFKINIIFFVDNLKYFYDYKIVYTLPEVREMSVVAAAAVVAVARLLQPQHHPGQRRQLVAEKYLIAA